MSAITLKGVPEELMEKLREKADRERRSINQQAILLLERALSDVHRSFSESYEEFLEQRGPSPLDDEDLDELRDRGPARSVDL